MMRYLANLLLHFVPLLCFAQQLHPIDTVHYGELIDLHVDRQGRRYYTVNPFRDSLRWQGETYLFDYEAIAKPHAYGSDQLAALLSYTDTSRRAVVPAGDLLVPTTTGMRTYLMSRQDTLMVGDSLYHHPLDSFAQNRVGSLIGIEFDPAGAVGRSKQWPVPEHFSVTVEDSYFDTPNKRHFVVGHYNGILDTVRLDGFPLPVGTGLWQGFVGKLNTQNEFDWLYPISGVGDERGLKITYSNHSIIVAGNFDGTHAIYRGDSIRHGNPIPFQSFSPFLIMLDTFGNALAKSAIQFDGGTITVRDVGTLPDGNFFVSGRQQAPNLTFGDLSINAVDNRPSEYLLTLDAQLEGLHLTNFSGSNYSPVSYAAVHHQGAIWVSGRFQADTLTIQNQSLVKPSDVSLGYYLAKFTTELELIALVEIPYPLRPLFSAGDQGLYAGVQGWMGGSEQRSLIFEIIDTSATTAAVVPPRLPVSVELYPNPVNDDQSITVSVAGPTAPAITELQLWSLEGKLLRRYSGTHAAAQQMAIPRELRGSFYLCIRLSTGRWVSKLLLVPH